MPRSPIFSIFANKREYDYEFHYPPETILLSEFLYEAIYQPDALHPVPRTILQHPSLWKYIEEFGTREGDLCVVAEIDKVVVGAVWTRLIHSYGFVDNKTPELSISLYPQYRNQGIGTKLIYGIFEELSRAGYRSVSLSVSKQNPAVRMYLRIGFAIVQENDADYIMVHPLASKC